MQTKSKPHYITIRNPIEAVCSLELANIIKDCISYPVVSYKQGLYKKERKETMKNFLFGRGPQRFFWAGLVSHVVEYCRSKDIDVRVTDKSQEEMIIYEAELPGIKFRDDQLPMINAFLDNPRGIVRAPTGTGKTVMGYGILSGFDLNELRVLWLCHKKDLMLQAYDDGHGFGFKDIGRVGDGYAEYDCAITVATRQSFKNIADERGHLYDIVVVDEVHHVSEIAGEYAYVLARVMAPVRLGLTATPHPVGSQAWLTAVGLIGPVVAEMSINEANELGILAKPKIKILKMGKDHAIAELRKYSEVYDAAITNRLARNVLIATTAKKCVEANETILIMVNVIQHGLNLLEQLKALKVEAQFVRGATESETRTLLKNALIDGRIKCLIASVVWTEGVNIPTLNNLFNAGGGKSEIRTLQNVGRGLRKTKDKDEVVIFDIFDNTHRFLIEHFGERLCCYIDNGWI